VPRAARRPVGPIKPTTGGPRLRLVGAEEPVGKPITQISDPRWVLAVRTAEQLQGPILPPERRERLIALGRMLRLSPFDSNLVIAIVQDQARRGYAPQDCPRAGEEQLRMIPQPQSRSVLDELRQRPGLRIALLIGAIMTAEVTLLLWLF
jgi:hypothetical protein